MIKYGKTWQSPMSSIATGPFETTTECYWIGIFEVRVAKLDWCLPSWHYPWPAKHEIMGKIINFRNRRTTFKSWLCYILFSWPSICYLIIQGSSFLICKRISSPNSQVCWEDWMWQCVWNATYFFSLTISFFQRIFLLNLEIYPFI